MSTMNNIFKDAKVLKVVLRCQLAKETQGCRKIFCIRLTITSNQPVGLGWVGLGGTMAQSSVNQPVGSCISYFESV